jgi:hypothetical protein
VVAEAVRTGGSDAVLKALSETAAEDVGSWVEGFIVVKVGPAKAALEAIGRLPAMGGKPAAMFCTYGVNPRGTLAILRRSLEEKGANVVAESTSSPAWPLP